MYWSWEVAFDVLPQLAKGVIITVEATIVASLLAYVLGLGIAILKMSKSKLLRVVLYWITEFIRRTPILVQLYIVFYVLPDYGIFFEAFTCGVIVLGVHFSTYTSEVFRAGIDNVSKGQWEAAKSLNYNKLFQNHEKKIFLDIGFKKTCLAVYEKDVLIHLNSIPVGGNHITSDISQILKLSREDSEILKKSLNKTETIFSDNDEIEKDEISLKW